MLPGRAYSSNRRCISEAWEDIQRGTLSEGGGGTVDSHVLDDVEKGGTLTVI